MIKIYIKEFFFCILIIVPIFSYSQNYISVSGDTSGYTPGSFQITDEGAANYTIPLVLVPGTNGVQPSLALTYNSQGGNSIVGQGWSLQGISAIARTAQTYAQDGKALGITFTATDRFALDGERLVPVDSTIPYGSDASEYRTEQNAFYQIHAVGTTTGTINTPQSFLVRTNSGNIMEYGNTSDSRINITGANTIFWLVNKVSDTKGNYFTFTYFKDSITGENYPIRIDYTGNSNAGILPYASVRFTYENRLDTGSKYLNGIAISANKHRLTAVKSYYGSTLVRAYYLYYQNSPSNVSQLISVQECGSDGHCHTPANFIWSNITAPSFSPVDLTNIAQNAVTDNIVSIDANADGVQDILRISQFGTGSIQAYLSNKNVAALAFNNTPVLPSINVTSKYAIADFNADGKPDILLYDSISGTSTVYLNTDSIGASQVTFNNTTSSIPTTILSNKFVAALDFNSDGRSDILSFDPLTGHNYWLLSNTTGIAGTTFIPNGNLNYFTDIIPDLTLFQGSYQPFFTDYNGDGKTDIIFWNPSSGNTALYKNTQGTTPLSFTLDSANFINPAVIAISGGIMNITDVNGDGLPDILFYVKSTGANSWWINKGNKKFIPVNAGPSNLNTLISGGTNLMQSDFNGDGYADLIWMDKSTGQNRWFVNDGKLNFTQLPGNVINPTSLIGYDLQGSGNFSSKSSLDLFLFNNSGTPKARILKGTLQYNNLISQIQVGSGQVMDITYDLLTSDSVYSKSNNAIYPLMDYQATQFVVKSWQTDNGVGTKSSSSYKYSGAKIHLAGRGFRGFSEVDITDNNTGIIISKFYQNDTDSWKYISSPLVRTITKLPTGVIISQTDIVNGLSSYYYNKCNYSYVKNNSSKTYETDGTFVDSTNTSYIYDDYGNVIQTVTDYGGGSKDSLVNKYDNTNTSNWLISRLMNSHLYRSVPGHPVIIKASAFTYDIAGSTGLLTSEITEPDSSNMVKIIKNYTYDVFGNITSSSVTAWNVVTTQTRTTHTIYDSLGRYIRSFKNALGQVSSRTTDPLLGKVLTETDLNGLVKQYVYDGYGRLIKTTYPDGNWESLDYRLAGTSFTSAPLLARHLIYQQSSVAPPVIKYYDILNREIRTHKKGFSGQNIFSDIGYNNIGQNTEQSLPYFDTATPVYTQYFYDAIGRKTAVIEPGNRIDSVFYKGRITIYKNANGQIKTIINNAKEQMVIARDNEGHDIAYDYDAAGRLLKTTDPLGNNIVMAYDIHGNKTSMTDPDMKTYTYVTNGFGELIKQTDPLGHILTATFDSLSRMISRTEPEGTTTWSYDSRPHGIGLLGTVTNYNGEATTNTYDSLSRITSQAQVIDGMTYNQGYTYDAQGRIKNTIYPTGFSTTNMYNANGYLYQVKNTASGLVYWTAAVMNAKDEITQQQYGNGTQINKNYDVNTDFLTAVNTKYGSSYLQNMLFTYDALGNLQNRKDVLLGKEEDFYYDSLNRLLKTNVLGLDSVVMTYDMLGNIASKSDVGVYHYGTVNNGPHQLMSVDITTTECIPSLLVNTLYNSFNKVRQISKDADTVNIFYNADRLRNMQKMYINGSLVRTKIYVSSIFEKEVKGGDTIITNYIKTPEGNIAAFTTHSLPAIASSLQYFHKDHLGSTVMITDDTAQVIGRYSFDAWGKRRNADWSAILTDTLALAFDRGFTGHEHYGLFDMVDMNGRVYDPVLGRFLSADPFIQDMTDLQCYNRYSYVCNNPLSLTDPTGYFSLFKSLVSVFKDIGHAISSVINTAVKWVSDNWRSIAVAAVTLAATAITGGLLAGADQLLITICSSAAGGFASGVTSTLLNGGNIGSALLAGVRGAVITAVTAGLNAEATIGINSEFGSETTFENVAQKTVSHGLLQGLETEAKGGKFLNGFYSSVTNSLTGFASEETSKITDFTTKVVVESVIGGTKSELTGGSFVNGAATTSFDALWDGIKKGETLSIGSFYVQGLKTSDKDVKYLIETNIIDASSWITIPHSGIIVGSDGSNVLQQANNNFQNLETLFNEFKPNNIIKNGLPNISDIQHIQLYGSTDN